MKSLKLYVDADYIDFMEKRIRTYEVFFKKIKDHLDHKWGCTARERIHGSCDCGYKQIKEELEALENGQ